jgi:hypothetical protein
MTAQACCPRCGGVVERTSGEATRTMAPTFASRKGGDLYSVRVTVTLAACTSCEWVCEAGSPQFVRFTDSDTIPDRAERRD